ncbi:hypothetical protein KP509_17G005100 [Ceratopteris richardii]|uniref:EF-hand domain-containing protein n=1 Tax=Ceratopteris richardii TaxID=49495 RepID=A0A8T2SU14_CERRI|nr:hypothetical protein KP509_17G005100 [Ceratopteris richardii]
MDPRGRKKARTQALGQASAILEKAPNSAEMYSPDSSIAEEGFHVFDLDKNGSITKKELMSTLKTLGIQDIREEDLQRIISENDKDDNGTIEIHEFISMVAQAGISEIFLQQLVYEEIAEAFHAFDKNKDGNLSEDELILVLQSLGMNPTERLVKEMMEEADIDHDGFINHIEFQRIMRALK